MLALRLPFSFDPLIAEAKQRMRRRRAALFVLAVAGAAASTFALWPSGSSPAGRFAHGATSAHLLARLDVPVDGHERAWRSGIRAIEAGRISPAAIPSLTKLRRAIRNAGAVVVRMRAWPQATAVELVLATAVNPATYLRHRAGVLVDLLARGYPYVKIVDPHGAMIFEWYYLPNRGMAGVPPALRGCSPVKDWGPTPPPRPVK